MSTFTKKYASINVGQLKQMLDGVDEDKEIRIWVEMQHDESILLEGRRLIGIRDDPYEQKYLCLVAGYYVNDVEDEEE